MNNDIASRRLLLRGGLSLAGFGLLAGCAETRAVTDTVGSAAGSAVSGVSSAAGSAVSGLGSATGTRLGADAVAGQKPSGTVSLRAGQAAFIAAGTGGAGTLKFKGRSYAFNIGGAGLGGIGASSITATGEVFNLKSPADFAGTYGQVRYGFAAGTASGGDLWLQNQSGVILHLRARRTGLMLSLGADAMIITMA